MNIEMIKAIGGLWSLAFVVCFTILAIIFREQLRTLLRRVFEIKLKRGETEVSYRQLPEETEAKTDIRLEEKAAPERPIKEADDKTSKLEPRTPGEWGREMFHALLSGNVEDGETAFTQMQEAETDSVQRQKNEVLYLWLCYRYTSDTAALRRLEDLALSQEAEVSKDAYFWMGHSYETVGDFEKAAKAFDSAAQISQTESERAHNVTSTARCFFKGGRQQEGLEKIMQEIGKVTTPGITPILYEGLASLYQLAEDPELRALALEKVIESRPNDTQLRFAAAHSYGQTDLDHLSLLHYKTLLQFDPKNASALNNLAVQYEVLHMPMHSVRAYNKAVERDETLASANLAYRLMNAGFAEEARQILDKAREEKDIHPNVGGAIAALSEKEGEESKTEQNALKTAREQETFLHSFAEAYFIEKRDSPSFAGVWRFPDGVEMTMTQSGEQVEGKWIRDKIEYKLKGHASNRAARITTTRLLQGRPFATILGGLASGEDSRGYIYLAPDGQKLFLMNLKDQKHSLLTLDKIS